MSLRSAPAIYANEQRGAVMPIMAAVIMITAERAALAADVGRAHAVKADLHAAADSAALAAAIMFPDANEAQKSGTDAFVVLIAKEIKLDGKTIMSIDLSGTDRRDSLPSADRSSFSTSASIQLLDQPSLDAEGNPGLRPKAPRSS
ncbi:MAG: pilus assembly protein TadG-related protein [Pseudomonadota bacterium]